VTAGFGDLKHATNDNLDAGGMATSPAGKKKKNLISDACTSDMENKIIIKNEVNNLAADIITKWLS
jgi:hypothetical protein